MKVFKLVMIATLLSGIQMVIHAQTGRKPTTFPDLPSVTDNTLFFTQDAGVQESYKFTVKSLKDYIFSTNVCLGSAFHNPLATGPQSPVTLQANSVGFDDVLYQLSQQQIHACDANTQLSIVPSNMQIGDGLTYHIDPVNTCSITGNNETPNWEFTLGYPITTITDIIDKITVKAKLHSNNNIESWTVLTLNVDGNFVNDISTGESHVLGVGTGDIEYNFVYKNTSNSPLSTLRASFLWWDGADFDLDGIEVICDLKGQTTKMVLSTDANGCLKMETIDMSQPFTLQATNGLSLQDANTVKLGGSLNQNTGIEANNNDITINNPNVFNISTHSYDYSTNTGKDNNFNHTAQNTSFYAGTHNDANNSYNSSSLDIYNHQISQYSSTSDGQGVQASSSSSVYPYGVNNFTGNWDNVNNITQQSTISTNANSNYQSVSEWNNANNSYRNSSINTSMWGISQTANTVDGVNNISNSSSIYINAGVLGFNSSYNDNTNLSNNKYTSFQLNPDNINFYIQPNNNESFMSGSLNRDLISYTLGNNNANTYTGYNQYNNEIGISASDYIQNKQTKFRVSPLAMYVQTNKVNSNMATVGQVLTLKNAYTGEVEFEDATTGAGASVVATNGITGNGTNGNPLKLGGALTENTNIGLNGNSFSIAHGGDLNALSIENGSVGLLSMNLTNPFPGTLRQFVMNADNGYVGLGILPDNSTQNAPNSTEITNSESVVLRTTPNANNTISYFALANNDNAILLTGLFSIRGNNNAQNIPYFNADANNGKYGISYGFTPRSSFDIRTSDAIIIPVGTTAQRPTPVKGMERFNVDINGKEIYDGTNWIILSGTWSSTTRPTGIGAGSTGFNITLSQKEYWNGTSWVQF